MKYDFDRCPDRRHTDAIKWMTAENELPMWIADMDFDAAPEIKAALQARLDRGAFGYGDVTDDWYDAYIGWWERRHGFRMKKEGLIFCTGVIPAISAAVRKLTTPAEKAVLMTPVYNIFYNSVLNNGRVVLPCPLKEEDGAYDADLDALEAALADPQTALLILCNPHNPVGKIWDRETLAKIGALAKQYGVTVLSDEIHCDLTAPGKAYVPFLSASADCRDVGFACIAPTKAFNLAGMQTAAVYCENPLLRHKLWRALNTDEVAEPNSFAVPAAVAAFTQGEAWLDALRAYLWENRRLAEEFIQKELPRVRATKAEATYLLWLDCRDYAYPGDLAALIRETSGLIVCEGAQYGAQPGFLRLNLACARATLRDGLDRLKKSLRGI